jgi:hypothetical protein
MFNFLRKSRQKNKKHAPLETQENAYCKVAGICVNIESLVCFIVLYCCIEVRPLSDRHAR